MYVCAPCVQCLREPEENFGSPGIGDTDNSKPPCGCWKLNLGPLQEKQRLLLAELFLIYF